VAVSGVMCVYVHPSILSHGTAPHPLGGFSSNLILKYFSNIRQENSSFIKIWQQ